MPKHQDIVDLYDSLFEMESQFKKDASYPIHKRMNFGKAYHDIYDFLRFKIDIQNKTILDAGCGVGFGSFLLAKNGAKHVKGISISSKEIQRANQVKEQSQTNNIEFEVASFDDTQPNRYDIIICIESLKHTLNFEQSFNQLLAGLKPNGILCIVDDFFDKKHNKTSMAFQKDWHLNYLISLSDVTIDEGQFEQTQDNLKAWLYPKSLWKINLKLWLFRAFKRNSNFTKLFRGGLLLDKLYAQKKMDYLIVQIKRR
ncbi:MAG: class I SAM-dependent methyltransferase [Flavobacterium sp.]|uniref:class I SAM-dependent methyltransferase n=1 Tax=Flavobacterium sp. TaxID=239 RepID=UPI00391DA97C